MRYTVLAVGAVGLAVVVAVVAAEPPKLGPEWTYDKEMKQYEKTMPIKVTRSGGGNTRGYYLNLEYDKVMVHDTDGNIATGVRINDTIHLDIRKDPKGGPGKVTFGTNKCSHHDLDGDGVWDAWSDSRGAYTKCFIRHDGGWVQVGDSKSGFGDGPALSLDRKTEYTWDGRAWTSRPANR